MMPYVDASLSAQEVAEIFGVHEDTVKRWAKAGAIPYLTTPGGRWRFKRQDVEAFLDSRAQEATA